MFEEPNETPAERSTTPTARALEKADEFRMHSELAAVFEGPRKFDAQLLPGLNADLARDVQRGVAKLEKSRTGESGILPDTSASDAVRILNFYGEHDLSTNDYHIYRRPGEVMMVRWIAGDEVEAFYERLQAHFDAALEGTKEDERQANEWKQDAESKAYLTALDAIQVNMADRYRRDAIRKEKIFVLSTQTADEMNIAYLCDHIMSVPAAEFVGAASAPPSEEPTETDLAWFFKLYLLRGVNEDGVEQMCFFAYLQKSDDSGW